MVAHVLLKVLNELMTSDTFNTFNNTGTRMLDSFYHYGTKVPRNCVFRVESISFCHLHTKSK